MDRETGDRKEPDLIRLKKAYLAAKRLSRTPLATETTRETAQALARKIAAEIADLKWPKDAAA